MGQTMSVKASVFIATSLDGFIARTDGNIDWLDKANARVPDGEDCGYKAFIDSVDVLVMGRNTFELALTFGEWPYHDKRVLVLSSKAIAIPQHIAQAVSCSSASPGEGSCSIACARRQAPVYRRRHHHPTFTECRSDRRTDDYTDSSASGPGQAAVRAASERHFTRSYCNQNI